MQVNHHLLAALGAAGFAQRRELWHHPPLDAAIYPCAWDAAEARTALELPGGRYEAGGNLTWLDPFPAEETDSVIAGDEVSWSQILAVEELHFGDAALAPKQGKTRHRVIFPITVPVYVADVGLIEGRSHFPSTLKMVCGHVYIYGWYLGMFRALRDRDMPRVIQLWQGARTVAFQCRVIATVRDAALYSLALRKDGLVDGRRCP